MENFSLWPSSKGFWSCPKMRLTTNKSPSRGISHSSSLGGFWRGSGANSRCLGTMVTYDIPPLTIMVLFVGQLAAMCPKPKHLKHFDG